VHVRACVPAFVGLCARAPVCVQCVCVRVCVLGGREGDRDREGFPASGLTLTLPMADAAAVGRRKLEVHADQQPSLPCGTPGRPRPRASARTQARTQARTHARKRTHASKHACKRTHASTPARKHASTQARSRTLSRPAVLQQNKQQREVSVRTSAGAPSQSSIRTSSLAHVADMPGASTASSCDPGYAAAETDDPERQV
jgi:hypothetical protein